MSGHRHPFYTKYRVGFSKDGLIKALDTDIYNNAGYSLDLSFSVMHRAMFHVDNAYNIPKVCFLECCPCPFIQFLSRFYHDFIQYLSKFRAFGLSYFLKKNPVLYTVAL